MHQVFELVLPYVLDVKTLLICSTLSQQRQQLVQDAVRLNLAPLVKQLLPSVRQHYSRYQVGELQLLWLCRMAGPAALNTHDNACAIFWALAQWPTQHPRFKENVLQPLVMTTKLLVHVVVWHKMPLLLDAYQACNMQHVDPTVRRLAWALALYEDGEQNLISEQELHALLQKVTHSNLPDLFRMLARCSNNSAVSDVLSQLLEHDKNCVHLLHPISEGHAGQHDAAATTVRSRAAGAQPFPHAQQQQSAATAWAGLPFELLHIAVRSSCVHGVQVLCSVPSARSLGMPQVLQLTCMAAIKLQAEDTIRSTTPCIMASLCSLPAAQSLPAASIAAALHQGISSSCSYRLRPLLQLPNAKQLSAQCLCGLIKAAAAAEAFELVKWLSRLADGRRLDSRPIIELAKLFMDAKSRPDIFKGSALPEGSWPPDRAVECLDDLKLGEHLTRDDVLGLLEFVADKGLHCWDKVCWQPAASQISDTPRLVRVLQRMVSCEPADDLLPMPAEPLRQMLEKLPALRQLTAADWNQVLACTFRAGYGMPGGCLELPGVQQMSTAQVVELLRVCIESQLLMDVRRLLQLPVSKLLSGNMIAGLLQDFLQVVPSYKVFRCLGRPMMDWYALCWNGLLSLPNTAEMTVEVVQQLYTSAFELGFAGMAKALLDAVPRCAEAVRPVTGERLARGMLAAIRHVSESGDLQFWAQEPGWQSLDASSCVQLLEALLQLSKDIETILFCEGIVDPEIVHESERAQVPIQVMGLLQVVLQVPTCKQLKVPDIVTLSKACLGPAGCSTCTELLANIMLEASKQSISALGISEHILDMWDMHGATVGCCHQRGALMSLFLITALPAAAQIDAGQLVSLLFDACKESSSACVFRVLLQLPAAQEITPAQVAAVLGKMAESYCAKDRLHHSPGFDVDGVAGLLLQHPVGQQLSVSEVSAVLVHIVQQQPFRLHVRSGSLLGVAGQLLRHPAGQQLSGETLAHLMQVTVWQNNFVGLALMCLQHPGAISMTTECACQLLELFAGHTGSVDAVSKLLQLPAVQQLSLSQIKPLLWQACRSVDQRIYQVLLALPAVPAAQDDPEVGVIVTTGRLFAVAANAANQRTSNSGHVEQAWCTCPGCRSAE